MGLDMASSASPQSGDTVRVRVEYRDAAGNWHTTFALERDDGRRVRGEAVFDPKFNRTLLDEDLPGLLPKDVRVIKRAVVEACAAAISTRDNANEVAPTSQDGLDHNG